MNMIGQKIQNYKIISLLGEGGMANVYLAENQLLGNKVALKLLKEEFVQHPNIRKRFLAEARNLAQMSHPNIIKVTDLINAGDIVAFVMEYIEGDTLEYYIEHNAKLPNEEIESFLKRMIEAVEYVHSQGLIHRDIKPSNFMLTKGGAIKLLDFGIAKNTNDDAADYTKTGLMQQMGTPMYMSPEQVKNTSGVTKETDIYSLGVVLWQMVMNKKPYDSHALSLPEIQVAILKEPLSLTKTIWDSSIQKATQKDPSLRYKSCNFWQSEIENLTVRNNLQSDKTEIDKASTYRNVNSLTNSQKAKQATNSKQSTQERKGYFNLKTVSIGIGILLFIGMLIIFNLSKHGNGDKSVTTIPENEKPEIVVPTETAEEPVLEKVEPITVEPKQLPKEKEQQEEVEKTTPIVSSSKLKIGQKYQGGIIFYVDYTGEHGKACAEKDLGKFDWNTAMEECQNLGINGFNDWYVPSISELKQLFIERSTIGFFDLGDYWSSTECGGKDVWHLFFLSGVTYCYSKNHSCYVRAVRAF
jgi:serine/threonine protein kinase